MVGVDHFLDIGIGTAAGLDTVDLAAQFVLEAGDVGERFQSGIGHVLRHGQGGLGIGEAGRVEDLDLLGGQEWRDIVVHRRFPVAEEDLQALVADAGKDDLLHRTGLLAVVAQAVEQHVGHARGGDHVGPTDHAHAHRFAGGRFSGHGLCTQECGADEGQQVTVERSFHQRGLTRQLYCGEWRLTRPAHNLTQRDLC